MPHVERAIEALSRPDASADAGREPLGRAALAYLQAVLEGRPREAIAGALEAVDDRGLYELPESTE